MAVYRRRNPGLSLCFRSPLFLRKDVFCWKFFLRLALLRIRLRMMNGSSGPDSGPKDGTVPVRTGSSGGLTLGGYEWLVCI